MHKTYLHISLITILLFFSSVLQAQPRLTVVVVIDGLTQENLTAMQPYWTAGGLRLLNEIGSKSTAYFPHQVYGGQETMATLMTGTTPAYHSIMSNSYFDRKERTPHSILEDPSSPGLGTSRTLSARSLPATTITDEWRIRYGAEAKIYAIGLQPEATILMAGHAADACCWLDQTSCKWVSTAFYPKGLTIAADQMNMSGHIDILIEQDWKPLMDIALYKFQTEEERKRPFNYKNQQYLLQSPIANKLVIELALAEQESQLLGTDYTPDLLLLQLNTLTPQAKSDVIEMAEQEDMYLDLNYQLGILIEQLNKRIGKNQYQLLVIGRPVKGYSATTLQKANYPISRFNPDRAAALVSTYLMAIYGHERWVDGGYGPFIYLNRMLIEKKKMSLETIQRQVANFLMDFEGVQVAYPIYEAVTSDDKHSIYRKHAGDVYFRLQDNWQLEIDENTLYDCVIQGHPTVPIFHWTGGYITIPEGKHSATDIKSLILR